MIIKDWVRPHLGIISYVFHKNNYNIIKLVKDFWAGKVENYLEISPENVKSSSLILFFPGLDKGQVRGLFNVRIKQLLLNLIKKAFGQKKKMKFMFKHSLEV